MVLKITSFGADNELFKKAMQVRFDVFTNEQGIDKDIEFDGLDFDAVHYLVIADDIPVATARWRETKEGIKIERMAVLKDFRSLGIGTLLLRLILKELQKSEKKIYLHSQAYVKNFYEANHFVQEGETFVEAGIEHIKMVYKP